MALEVSQRGFTLLISVIFMSVMLSFGLALGSLGYKQQVLASDAITSQYAFYVADTALECALYADQQEALFAYTETSYDGNPKSMTCDGNTVAVVQMPPSVSQLISTVRLSLDSDTHCADVTVYKYKTPQAPDNVTTYLFSVGYDVSCSRVVNPEGGRFVSRGVSAQY
ncbi:hypothetical protein EXS57_03155 [Candidatus Kaiserbacteria bacterium]|nr:hypothetical protein [Candidatus Kaiserbacteria bacterium]